MAMSMTIIMVAAALVLDFGIMRLDRQHFKLAADDAVTAGMQFADGGSSDIFTQRAVCGALTFLRSNNPAMAGLPDSFCGVGWASSLKVCNQADPNSATSLADYIGTTTSGGVTYSVEIKSPYQLSDGSWPEESLSTLATDPSKMNGCDQLAVMISESRAPGLGGLATNHNMTTRVRSVGRFSLTPGPRAPALLLLEQHACSDLIVGSNGPGTESHIFVNATGNTPGTIHSDSDATGSDCGSGSNQQLFQGHQPSAIVAGNTATEQGYITSVGKFQGKPDDVLFDGLTNVHSLKPDGTFAPPIGMSRVTRRPADERYGGGIRSSLAGAASIWSMSNNPPAPWVKVGCNPNSSTITSMANMIASDSLYVDCSSNSGITWGSGSVPMILGAGRIVFNGFIAGGGISMPNATAVYVTNTDNSGNIIKANAITLSGSDSFCVRGVDCTTANATSNLCSTAASSGGAKLFVRQGFVKQTGGLLRLCHTTMILMGGRNDGCVPATNGTAPSLTPCGGTAGTGQLSVNGGIQDWTAPNEYAGFIPPASQAAAWANGEDLAMWAESAATNNDKYTMGGGGAMYVRGVYFTPNAEPFQLNGGASQGLINAQFIAGTFSVGGNSNLTMTVDPDNTIPLPKLTGALVR